MKWPRAATLLTASLPPLIFDAILNREPPAPTSINPGLPLKFEEIIGKALEKDARSSLSDRSGASHRFKAPEARHGQWARSTPHPSQRRAASPSPVSGSVRKASAVAAGRRNCRRHHAERTMRRGMHWSVPVFVGLLVAVAGSFIGLGLHNRYGHHDESSFAKNESTFMKMTISPVTSSGNIQSPVISGDGKWLAFVQPDNGTESVSVRQLATGSMAKVVPASTGVLQQA